MQGVGVIRVRMDMGDKEVTKQDLVAKVVMEVLGRLLGDMLVDEKVNPFLSQCLGKDICQLIFCSDKVEFNYPIFHLLLYEVISDVNMLGSGVLDVVTA
ncbi:hypothetical protein Tco_1419782 [Tanacetum coccineum]